MVRQSYKKYYSCCRKQEFLTSLAELPVAALSVVVGTHSVKAQSIFSTPTGCQGVTVQ